MTDVSGSPKRDASAYEQMAQKFVRHPQFDEAMADVLDALSLHGTSGEVPCLQVTGPTGVGKSTLKDKLAAEYATVRDGRRVAVPGCPDLIVDHVPLLQVEMPETPTVISFCQEALKAYGDPFYYRGQRSGLTRRFELAVSHAGTIGILVDEAQRAVDRFGVVVKDDLVEWLKSRQQSTKCVFILLGLGRLRHMFEKDPQIERRWDAETRIEPYRWVDQQGEEVLGEQSTIIAIIDAFQRASPIPFAPDMRVLGENEAAAEVAALRFFYACRGVIGYLKKLLGMVFRRIRRIEGGVKEIDRALLEVSFDKAFKSRRLGMQNPFAAAWTPYLENGRPNLPPKLDDDTLLLNPEPRRLTKKQRNKAVSESFTKS